MVLGSWSYTKIYGIPIFVLIGGIVVLFIAKKKGLLK